MVYILRDYAFGSASKQRGAVVFNLLTPDFSHKYVVKSDGTTKHEVRKDGKVVKVDANPVPELYRGFIERAQTGEFVVF